MGTYAFLYRDGSIPEEKLPEFRDRLERLFQAGGMMDVSEINLLGRRVSLLKKSSMTDKGMHIAYNYFEDDWWESAGFDQKHQCVYSGKIGGSSFHRVIIAAYELERLYTDGPGVVVVNEEAVLNPIFTSWINYLFSENYPKKTRDPWETYRMLKKNESFGAGEMLDRIDWRVFVDGVDAFLGYLGIWAVQEGAEKVAALFKPHDGPSWLDHMLWTFPDRVRAFRKNSALSDEEQIELLMDMLHAAYLDERNNDPPWGHDGVSFGVYASATLAKAPAFHLKAVSEIYQKDFWELWDRFEQRFETHFVTDSNDKLLPVTPVSTASFLRQDADDMIPYWEPGGGIRFSEDQEKWFVQLRSEFDSLMQKPPQVEHPLVWLMDMLNFADREYYRIFCFSDFFTESLEHLGDPRYLTLWQLFDEMLHDPEMREAGRVIFKPDGTGALQAPDSQGKKQERQLCASWRFMPATEKLNRARKQLRRYMALVANPALRRDVL